MADRNEELIKAALSKLTPEGMGQQALREQLGIDTDTFEALKSELLNKNLVSVYRARGGGIRLRSSDEGIPAIDSKAIQQAQNDEFEQTKKLLRAPKDEASLYPYVHNWALNNSKYGFTDARVIGNNHRRKAWDNPDVVAWHFTEFEFLVGHEVELAAIEVKLSFSIYSLWQAANYRRFAHQAILACYETADSMYAKEDGRLLETAMHLGVGLISLTSSGAGGSGIKCNEILSPTYHEPMRFEIDEFISDFNDLLLLPKPGRTIQAQITAAIQ